MARSLHTACLIAALSALGIALVPCPAHAQFNPFEALFGSPPRPPAGVPNGRPVPQPQYDPYQDDRFERPYPQQQGYPQQQPQQGYPQYPQEQPYPPQANVPMRPSPGGIQSQPLPPPPGTAAVDPRAPGQPPQAGLPPGQLPPRATPQPGDTQPGDEVVVEPPAQKIVNKAALFSGLDKITGRIINFDVAIGETVQFGALQVTPRACYTRPPTETPNTDAFVEVDEVTLTGEVKRIFTGWMFAASPGLHGVEHPIYDVWLSDCKSPPVAAAPAPEPVAATPAAAPAPKPAASKPAAPKPAAKPPAAAKRPPAQQRTQNLPPR